MFVVKMLFVKGFIGRIILFIVVFRKVIVYDFREYCFVNLREKVKENFLEKYIKG